MRRVSYYPSFLYFCIMVRIYAKQLVSDEEFILNEVETKLFAQKGTLSKIDTFKSLKNKQRKLVGEMLAFKGIQDCFDLPDNKIVFEYGPKGKPMLKDCDNIYFNISHSGEWVVCAISDRNVGIDIEVLKNARLNVANRFFTENEVANLNKLSGKEQDDYFFTLWTVKECYLKYLGTGLTKPLNSFSVEKHNNTIIVNESSYSRALHFRILDIDIRYKTALCFENSEDEVRIEKC